ncbi:MAG: hypothetical protein ACLFTA_03105 [Candidatus Nanohaloarchaea archaeon]
MEIIEEVARRRQTIVVEEPENVYSELRELLESRMSFDHVHEDKYFNDVESGRIRARIHTVEAFDKYTVEKLEIFLTIKSEKNELDLQIKAKLVTEYPGDMPWQNTIWYYAYRSLYDEFLYGGVREGYEPAVEEKLENLMTRVRETMEA